MKDQIIYSLAYRLKDEINSDALVVALNEIEAKLEKNDEVMKLAYKKDMAVLEYNDLLKVFKFDSKEVITSIKYLSEIKNELNTHPLVKEYLDKYKQVKELFNNINKILFSGFELDECKQHGN